MVTIWKKWRVWAAAAFATMLFANVADARIEGLTGITFDLTAKAGRISTPDANSLLFWGFANGNGTVQYPGPTLIINEGDTVTINLTNQLAEPVSLIFPGLTVTTSTAPVYTNPATRSTLRSLAPEAAPRGGTRTYTFVADNPGTFYYESGTDQAIQVRMGLFGAIIVRPAQNGTSVTVANEFPGHAAPGPDKTYTKFAYNDDDGSTGYDREYLFLVSEMDPDFQKWVEFDRPQGILFDLSAWRANNWFINGRSAPDDMDPAFHPQLPTQPYTAMTLMHPGERVLARFINMGSDFHPFHNHGNHMRYVAEDGRLLQSPGGTGADLSHEDFTFKLVPGKTADGIFTWTGKNLGWDIYGHQSDIDNAPLGWSTGGAKGVEDIDWNNNGLFDPLPPIQPYEYIADHGRVNTPHEVPVAATSCPTPPCATPTVAQALPVILPTNQELDFGPWWSGSAFMGSAGSLPPGLGGFNPYSGFFYMWHSHSERELTNNDIFPGGFLTMMGIIPWPATGQIDPIMPE